MLDEDKVVVVRVLRHGVSQQTVMQRLAKGLSFQPKSNIS